MAETGEELLPSRTESTGQHLDLIDTVSVHTESSDASLSLATEVRTELENGRPVCRVDYTGQADRPAAIVVSLRPCSSIPGSSAEISTASSLSATSNLTSARFS